MYHFGVILSNLVNGINIFLFWALCGVIFALFIGLNGAPKCIYINLESQYISHFEIYMA